jgi:beta-galactosidase
METSIFVHLLLTGNRIKESPCQLQAFLARMEEFCYTNSMNKGWKWTEGFQESYVRPEYDDKSWMSVDIPHAPAKVPFHYLDERTLWTTSTYRKLVSVPARPDWDRIVRFEGVSVKATVYFEGIELCVHEGAFTPFEVTLPKESGMLVVCVDGAEDPRIPPFGGSVDYLVFPGIYRPVTVFTRPKERLLSLSVESQDGKKVTVHAEATMERGSVDVVLRDGVSVLSHQSGSLENHQLSLPIEGLSLFLWDLKNPKCYEADVTFMGFTQTVRFGCRNAEFTFGGFFLNGKRIKLVGLDRHQCYPYTGYAMGESLQEEDAAILKGGGLNIVRTSHYPMSPAFLDACDRLGLLVFEEMPGWQHVSDDPHWRDLCLKNIEDMIHRDINHPSIVLWGVRINESQDDDELYRKTNALAHKLDPTRQTGGVRNFLGSHLLEDVYTFNDFSHTGDNPGLVKPKIGAPYLVTEHDGHMFPTKRYDDIAHRCGQFLRHMAVMESSYANERISGAIGWCYADYQTHSNFGSGDGLCHHGVYDQNRVPKFAAYAYISQQDKVPVLVSSSTFDCGDTAAGKDLPIVVATNCDKVNLFCDGVFVKTFYPARKRFPHVPHPPVYIDDLYGLRLQAETEFSTKEQQKVALLLKKMRTKGESLSWTDNIDVLRMMRRHKMTKKDLTILYSRWTGMLEQRGRTWRLDGIRSDKVVCSETYGPDQKIVRELRPDKTRLDGKKDGYDVARIILHIGKEGMTMPLPFAFEPYQVTVSGPLELLSPPMDATEGGVGGIYVRNTEETGTGVVTVTLQDAVLKTEFTIG